MTFVQPATMDEEGADPYTDPYTAASLVIEQAVGLAKQGNWHFRIIFEEEEGNEEPAELHYLDLHTIVPDVAFMFEHFSITQMSSKKPLGDFLDMEKQTRGGPPRGVIIFSHRCGGLPDEEAYRLMERARATGVHVWIIRRSKAGMPQACSLPMPAQACSLQYVCHNCITVRAEDQGGLPWGDYDVEVLVEKVRNRCAGDPSSSGVNAPTILRPPLH